MRIGKGWATRISCNQVMLMLAVYRRLVAFDAQVRDEIRKFAKVARDANIKVE